MQRYAMPESAGFEVRDLESLRERTPPAVAKGFISRHLPLHEVLPVEIFLDVWGSW